MKPSDQIFEWVETVEGKTGDDADHEPENCFYGILMWLNKEHERRLDWEAKIESRLDKLFERPVSTSEQGYGR